MAEPEIKPGRSEEEVNIDPEKRIERLLFDYANCLDEGRFDEWPNFFVEDCLYIIRTRENVDFDLEGYIIYCDSKAMLEDRVLSLQEVNLYNLHYDRHLISNIISKNGGEYIYETTSNYLIIQTNIEGRSSIFSTGIYKDKIVFDGGSPKFKEKIVIPDTFTVNTLLATPL